MRGEILHYDVEQGIGFIAADDGSRYMFARGALMQAQRVGKGTKVDFRPDGQNARQVYTVDPNAPAASTQPTASTSVPTTGQLSTQASTRVSASASPPAKPTLGPLPAGAPEMGIWGYFIHGITSGYGDFRGRARRKEYWSFALFYITGLVVLSFAGVAADSSLGNLDTSTPVVTVLLWVVVVLALFVPTLAVHVRRFHDVGLSGWLYPLCIVLSALSIGGIIIFIIALLPSQARDNKWGPVPEGVRP